MKTSGPIFNQKDIADMFATSTREVGRWVEQGLTHTITGRSYEFYVKDVHHFLLSKFKANLLVEDGDELLDLELEKARLLREQTITQKFKNRTLDKTLISIEQIERLYIAAIVQNKTFINQLPALISNRLNLSDEQQRSIAVIVKTLLTNFTVEHPNE